MAFYSGGWTNRSIDGPTKEPFGKRTDRLGGYLTNRLRSNLTKLTTCNITNRACSDIYGMVVWGGYIVLREFFEVNGSNRLNKSGFCFLF